MDNKAKSYTFRLTREDTELYDYLESLPPRKKSEAIRKLLLIAMDHINGRLNESVNNSNINTINHESHFNELKELGIETNELNREILSMLNKIKDINIIKEQESIPIKESSNEIEIEPEEESSVNNMMNTLKAFNIDFD